MENNNNSGQQGTSNSANNSNSRNESSENQQNQQLFCIIDARGSINGTFLMVLFSLKFFQKQKVNLG